MFRILLLLSSLSLTLAVVAQDAALRSSNFLVRIWQTEEGLPGNVVRSIGQTPDGFLWVATAEGLARFDGLEFESISPNENLQGSHLDFFRIFTPDDGSVWVATFSGGLLRVGNGRLERIVNDAEKTDPQLVSRLITFDNKPYFIRGDELWVVEAGKPVRVPAASPLLTSALEADHHQQTLRGRSDVTESPIQLEDRSGGSWYLRNGSLNYRAADDTSPSPPVPDFNGRLVINDLLEDREGNLWLASPVQGLIRIRHRHVTPLATPAGIYNYAVHTAVRDREGTWWLANRNGGVDRIRDGLMSHEAILTNGNQHAVSCIFEDRSGQLWFASRDDAVFKWDPQARQFVGLFPDTPALSKISAIAEDAEGRLWFGGQRGLWRWNRKAVDDFSHDPQIAGAEFSSLSVDTEGSLLAGTTDGRIFTFNGKSFGLLGNPGDLLGRGVSAILPVHPREIWVSTIGAGLFLWKDGRWHRFGAGDGLPDERLTGLALVGEDSFWMGSLGGILSVSRTELLQGLANERRNPHWLRLDRSDGMITRECVGGAQPGIYRDKAGNLWFPTTAGLAGLKPGRIARHSIPPAVRFHSVEINGVPRPIGTGSIAAGPGRVHLSFQFTGLSLSAPEKVFYQVRLVGFEEHPLDIGSRREIDYLALPPGHYTLQVSATNGEGVWSVKPASMSIVIHPHIWETAWFIVLVAIGGLLLALAIGWFIARRRMQRKIQDLRLQGMLEAERSRISGDLHDDLGASLTELSILSEIAAEDPDDGSLRPSLNQLSVKAKRVVGALDEIVWATNPTEDSLRSLIEYLPAFAREFLEVVQVPLRTRIERQIPDIAMGPGRRHNVLLATREAINNAVKYARPQSIFLQIAIDDDQLMVRIRDDGQGFNVECAAAGNGLANMRNRMTGCGGDCMIESVPGEGTTVTLTLPLTS